MPDMHEIDYKIFGDDMQFVEVELDPNEATVAEAGGMMYMEDGIEMETIFGDGSQQQASGFMGALMGAGKRLLTGESLFMTVFQNRSGAEEARRVRRALSGQDRRRPPRRDRRRADRAEGLVPRGRQGRRRSASRSRSKLGVGLFGGEGFIMQRLQGDGWAFVHAGGTLHERTLAPGELAPRRHRLHRRASSRRSTTTSSSSARSSRRSSAARDCSSPRCAGPAASGCSRCRSAAWRAASSPRRPGCGTGGREEGSLLGGLGRPAGRRQQLAVRSFGRSVVR